ncbi:MAG: 1-acyl-sn-glycerol-3-phosphate acyltransferase [Oscillospiraceae bacterium]|nr:1-acyl-sn-glycerol-3-phosphate acyltransferase [Oscillospiraceae bacterium]
MGENKFYRVLYIILAKFFRFFYNIKIFGAENEPLEGGYIACANHLSNHDVIILAACLKRQVRYFAKAELFKIPLIKQLITALGAYPIERGKSDVASIKKTITLLEGGEIVAIYPQGTRFPGVHPSETKTHNGIGMFAYRTKVPVLPIAIETKKFKIRPFKRVNFRIGKPIYYDELNFETGARSEYEAAARYIFEKVVELI